MAWVDPETITSLIEAHGTDPAPLLRPAFEGDMGWPALLPIAHLEAFRSLAADRMPDDLLDDLAGVGVQARSLDLGDPGTVSDIDVQRGDLPPYAGPLEPASGHVQEWGSTAADEADDAPLPGPLIAPWESAPEG
jgi:hypothetical protein